jgi:recombination protein RecA
VVKNKVAPPFRKTEIELMFGKGISAIGSLLDCAVKYDIIKKSGAWYSYNDEKIGQGRDNTRAYLEQHPDFTKELEAKLRRMIMPGREPAGKAGGVAAAPQKPEAVPPAAVSEAAEVAEAAPVFETDAPPAPQRGRPRKTV